MFLDSSQISDWRFQSLEQLQESSSDEDDEFFDAQGTVLGIVLFCQRYNTMVFDLQSGQGHCK